MCNRFRNGVYSAALNLLEGVKTVTAEIDPGTSSACTHAPSAEEEHEIGIYSTKSLLTSGSLV